MMKVFKQFELLTILLVHIVFPFAFYYAYPSHFGVYSFPLFSKNTHILQHHSSVFFIQLAGSEPVLVAWQCADSYICGTSQKDLHFLEERWNPVITVALVEHHIWSDAQLQDGCPSYKFP